MYMQVRYSVGRVIRYTKYLVVRQSLRRVDDWLWTVMACTDCGRTTTTGSCTCCWSTCVEANCSPIYVTPVASPPARRCSTQPRSSWRSNTFTRSVLSTVISNPRTSCWTARVTSNSPTSASLRNSRIGEEDRSSVCLFLSLNVTLWTDIRSTFRIYVTGSTGGSYVILGQEVKRSWSWCLNRWMIVAEEDNKHVLLHKCLASFLNPLTPAVASASECLDVKNYKWRVNPI